MIKTGATAIPLDGWRLLFVLTLIYIEGVGVLSWEYLIYRWAFKMVGEWLQSFKKPNEKWMAMRKGGRWGGCICNGWGGLPGPIPRNEYHRWCGHWKVWGKSICDINPSHVWVIGPTYDSHAQDTHTPHTLHLCRVIRFIHIHTRTISHHRIESSDKSMV